MRSCGDWSPGEPPPSELEPGGPPPPKLESGGPPPSELEPGGPPPAWARAASECFNELQD